LVLLSSAAAFPVLFKQLIDLHWFVAMLSYVLAVLGRRGTVPARFGRGETPQRSLRGLETAPDEDYPNSGFMRIVASRSDGSTIFVRCLSWFAQRPTSRDLANVPCDDFSPVQ
jgi:hypothetical protein